MRQSSAISLPIVWLLAGPPAFRLDESRGATASLDGSFDLWNYVRMAWWLLFGLMALRELILAGPQLRDFLRRAGTVPAWTAVWLLTLCFSAFFSPAPLFTLANVAMLSLLGLAALDLAVRIYSGRLNPRDVVRALLWMSISLLVLIGALALYDGRLVGLDLRDGLRIRGGSIAYAPLLSLIAFFAGLYFWFTGQGSDRWAAALAMMLGLIFIALGQTRSAYAGLVVGLMIFTWQWTGMRRNIPHLLTGSAVAAGVIALAGLLYQAPATHSTVDGLLSFVVRNETTVTTMSGRTEVFDVLLDHVWTQPMGLGFSAGPREVLQTSPEVTSRFGDGFGNAHNAFLEVVAGAGFIGLFAFLALIAAAMWAGRRLTHRAQIPLNCLFAAVLLEGLTESELVLPFKQTSVLFWLIAGILIGLAARPKRVVA